MTNSRPFRLVPLLFIVLFAIFFASAQAGLLQGQPATALGVTHGKLAPPSATANSVSSQAYLYPDHPQRAYASVEPFRPAPGETLVAAWQRLGALVSATPDVTVTETRADYLRAEATTRWLRFVDDVEWWRDDANDVIHVRSASRLGQRDFGANRQRIEAWRAAFDAGPATQ
jgi:uncharacterized protein (DUF1499 family)